MGTGRRQLRVLTFETDGVDMVWVEGDTSNPGKLVLDWMTAPYTTDAGVAAGKAHRLRSFAGRPGWPSAVGCGYAVSTSDQVASALRIVRLTDGVSWTLPGSPKYSPTVQPIGVTCDEVYGIGWYGDTASGKPIHSVVRFRLDALGPGIPPD